MSAVFCACVGPSSGNELGDEAGETGGGETGGEFDPIPEACQSGGEAPQTIAELVAHIEALPHPVTIPCLLASLPRPLSVVATDSKFSVQPADGPDNPRIFVLGEGLILSVVPVGDGARLLEFSEWISPTHTIKGELEFPITGALSADAPYDLGLEGFLTRCGVCHRDEYEVPGRPGVHASEAIRPAEFSLVPIDGLDAVLASCDWVGEPARCEMLSGLLDFGELVQGEFPEELPTIFDEP